ncbi:MAG: M23 family peptidase, partial [Pseudomonadota bacterium]
MNRLAATFALVLATTVAQAIELPQQRLAPGGVARIALGASADAPRARFNGVPVMVVREGSQWLALVGIGLAASPGPAILVLQRDGTETSLPFSIKPFHYAEQRLKVAPGQVDLAPDDLARYERESAHLKQVIATWSEALPGALRLAPPVPGMALPAFGFSAI